MLQISVVLFCLICSCLGIAVFHWHLLAVHNFLFFLIEKCKKYLVESVIDKVKYAATFQKFQMHFHPGQNVCGH